MPKRSYRQRCALACALDLVGERWTLLLIRELLTGPRRYKELLDALKGMGTNLLADRLKELVTSGLLTRDGNAYSLTERGAELEDSVLALARFGAPLLRDVPEDALWRPHWNVVALKYAFRPEKARSLEGVLEYRVDDSLVQARLKNGALETSASPRWRPDVTLTADGDTFLALATGDLDPKTAEASGHLTVEGDRRLYRASLKAFAL